jgi:hypothetical protein
MAAWRLALDLDLAEQAGAAADFYPWWESPAEPAFWTKTCLAMLWSEAVWRAPRNDWERFVHGAIFAAAGKARELGGAAAVSPALEEGLSELSASIDADIPASPGGIGYRRGPVSYQLFESWWIEAPGHLIVEPEGTGTARLWFGPLEIRATCMTVVKKEPDHPLDWTSTWEGLEEHEGAGHRFRVSLRAKRTEADDAWFAMAECMHDGHGEAQLLLLSLTSDDEATHIDRLHELAKGVRFSPPMAASGGGDA